MKIARSTPRWTLVSPLFVLFGANSKFALAWQNSSVIGTCPPIGPPPFSIDENPQIISNDMGVTVQYKIEVPYTDWVSFEVADYNCTNPLPTEPLAGNQQASYQDMTAPILADLVTTKLTNTGNNNDASSVLELQINPYHLNDYSTIYTEASRSGQAPAIESTGQVKLCVVLSIWNGVPPSNDAATSTTKTTDEEAVMVTYLETGISFDVKFTVEDDSSLSGSNGGRQLEQLATPSNIADKIHNDEKEHARRKLCEETWGVEVFTCPSTVEPNTYVDSTMMEQISAEPSSTSPITQGDTVRLCVQPNAAAMQAGVMMSHIQGLIFTIPTNPMVTQSAIETGVVSSDGLTEMYCEDGYQLCIVETSLENFFFDTKQDVSAIGTAVFQSSQETRFVELDVNFQLVFPVEPGSKDSNNLEGSAGFSTTRDIAVVSWSSFFLLSAVAGLALAL